MKNNQIGSIREFGNTSADRLLRLQRSYGEFNFSGLESEDENLSDEESVSADEEAIISEGIDSEDE